MELTSWWTSARFLPCGIVINFIGWPRRSLPNTATEVTSGCKSSITSNISKRLESHLFVIKTIESVIEYERLIVELISIEHTWQLRYLNSALETLIRGGELIEQVGKYCVLTLLNWTAGGCYREERFARRCMTLLDMMHLSHVSQPFRLRRFPPPFQWNFRAGCRRTCRGFGRSACH